MAKIIRKHQAIFAGNSDVSLFNQFGSAALGSPVATKDLDTIQALAAFGIGFTAETVGDWIPVLEDFNALYLMETTQIAYILQAGIPEWETATVYYIGSFCQLAGNIYVSLTDANTGNAVTDTTKWQPYATRFSFGTWQDLSFSDNVPQQILIDGFLCVVGSAISTNSGVVDLYSDSNPTPTRILAGQSTAAGKGISLFAPIKKGDYFKIVSTNLTGLHAYWLPFGIL